MEAAGNVLARKLRTLEVLPAEDLDYLDKVVVGGRRVRARGPIIREGQRPDDVHLVVEGLACRYKLLKNGRRQLVAYLVPGDFCDLHVFVLDRMDHSIAAVSECEIAYIPRQTILEMLERPALARALWRAQLVDEAVLREWLLNLGQRSAGDRLAHLIYELFMRLGAVGLTDGYSYRLPVTQEELGDTMGLSTVHTNRALQSLRREGLIRFERGLMTIVDPAGLRKRADFRANYLHLQTPVFS
jgi:CRP-like cAMP-binding protein